MSAASTTTTVPTSVTADRLRDWMSSPTPPRILDVRTPGEFESVHIPGSYLVPLDTLREHRRELADHVDEEGRRGAERWDLERQVRLVAGSIVLASGLASVRFPRMKWLVTAIGAGLTGAAVTDTCAMGMALSKLPYNQADEPDIEDVLAGLSGDDER